MCPGVILRKSNRRRTRILSPDSPEGQLLELQFETCTIYGILPPWSQHSHVNYPTALLFYKRLLIHKFIDRKIKVETRGVSRLGKFDGHCSRCRMLSPRDSDLPLRFPTQYFTIKIREHVDLKTILRLDEEGGDLLSHS